MLRELGSDDSRFRTVTFQDGLNLLVADRTTESTDDQSRNAVGKSSMVELLHFLLGSRKIPVVEHKQLKQRTFRLLMDWPGRSEPLSARRSSGTSNMKTFCFDLTWAVLAHRAGRGPDFLVHDSKLYDGVDERQVERALSLAASVTAEEGMQYIVTMNSDDLEKGVRQGFDPAPFVVEPRLNDSPQGGLFGFRF